MARIKESDQAGWQRTTAFAVQSRSDRIARLIVLDMVLWPGALFLGATLFVAYRVREYPLALLVLLVATLWSAAVGARQWYAMLSAVFLAGGRQVARHSANGEDCPRPTGRGTTEG